MHRSCRSRRPAVRDATWTNTARTLSQEDITVLDSRVFQIILDQFGIQLTACRAVAFFRPSEDNHARLQTPSHSSHSIAALEPIIWLISAFSAACNGCIFPGFRSALGRYFCADAPVLSVLFQRMIGVQCALPAAGCTVRDSRRVSMTGGTGSNFVSLILVIVKLQNPSPKVTAKKRQRSILK